MQGKLLNQTHYTADENGEKRYTHSQTLHFVLEYSVEDLSENFELAQLIYLMRQYPQEHEEIFIT